MWAAYDCLISFHGMVPVACYKLLIHTLSESPARSCDRRATNWCPRVDNLLNITWWLPRAVAHCVTSEEPAQCAA